MYTPNKKTPRKPRPARPVSEFVGKIIEPVLSRRSGMTIDLLAAWPELVGEDYCDFTRPERIKWPNRANEDDPFKPGILIVACDGARALYFQHDLSRICERVNVFFGFAAIEKIRIVQKPVLVPRSRTRRPEPKLDDEKIDRLNSILERIEDPQLRARLEKLGRGVMGRKRAGKMD
jgi:hypothetical protein